LELLIGHQVDGAILTSPLLDSERTFTEAGLDRIPSSGLRSWSRSVTGQVPQAPDRLRRTIEARSRRRDLLRARPPDDGRAHGTFADVPIRRLTADPVL
jgi:hypothetical protein